MKNKILIRADGGSSIGLGHLIRCQALGEMLRSDFKIEFYCKEIPDSLLSKFKQKNLPVNTIQEENEFLDVLNGDEIVVLDHYGLDTSFQKIIKERGNKLVCIDDLHDKEFYADLIINHAPGISRSDYKAQSYTHYALGPNFAILRPKFLNAALNKRNPEELDSIFVCFGGADPMDFTFRITEALLMSFGIHKINIVIGAVYSHSKIFELAKKDEFDIQIHNCLNEFELVDLMMKSDMAIAPSSTILYELISVKIPILSGYFTENQKLIFEGFKKLGCIYPLGDLSKMNDSQLINRISKYINKRNNVKLLKAQEKVIDGKSKERLINIFKTIC